MIFALRARPPCTKRRLSLREPKGYSSSSTPKMFNYWFIIPRFRRLSTGKLSNLSPFRGRGGERRFAARECAPIFFGSCPKKMAAPGQKKGAFAQSRRRWRLFAQNEGASWPVLCRLADQYRVRYTPWEQRWCSAAFDRAALLSEMVIE